MGIARGQMTDKAFLAGGKNLVEYLDHAFEKSQAPASSLNPEAWKLGFLEAMPAYIIVAIMLGKDPASIEDNVIIMKKLRRIK